MPVVCDCSVHFDRLDKTGENQAVQVIANKKRTTNEHKVALLSGAWRFFLHHRHAWSTGLVTADTCIKKPQKRKVLPVGREVPCSLRQFI
ncbi:MAG: hypothetical protein ACFHX7_04160 [Pseudomonadota bacterium]